MAKFKKMKLLPSSRGKPANDNDEPVPTQELKTEVPVAQLFGFGTKPSAPGSSARGRRCRC